MGLFFYCLQEEVQKLLQGTIGRPHRTYFELDPNPTDEMKMKQAVSVDEMIIFVENIHVIIFSCSLHVWISTATVFIC